MEKRGKISSKLYAAIPIAAILIFSLIVIVLAAEGTEDTSNWNKAITSLGNDAASSVAIDSSSNVYVVGSGTNLTNSSSLIDWWIKKFNSAGTEIISGWNKNFSGPTSNDAANSVAVDSNNNVYVAGSGTNLVSGSSNTDWWIKKFSSSGVEDTANWDKKIGTSSADGVQSVAIDSNNNIYVVGYGMNLASGSSFVDWWIKKFSSSGVEDTANWNKNFTSPGSNGDYAYGVAIDHNNNVYVVGAGWNLISASSQGDLWIKKFSSSGVEDTANWNKTFSSSGSNNDAAQSVAVDSNNNVYIAGYGIYLASGSSSADWWIKKFSSSGVEDTANWNKNFTAGPVSSDAPQSIKIDSNNNIYIAGYGTNLASGSSANDWWIKKFSSSGVENTTAWNKNFTSAGSNSDRASSVAVDSNSNNVYVVGSGMNLASGSSGIDWWVKKFEGAGAPIIPPAPNVTTFDTGSTNFSAVADITSVPNMTLAKTNTIVRWVGSVNASGQNFDNSIKIGSKFISINVSALDSTINTPAVINMTGINCTSFRIYYAAGYYATADNLIAAGTKIADQNNIGGNCADASKCTSLSCSGGVLTFTAQHFDGFGIGEGILTNLTIYDDSDTQTIYTNNSIYFYANFLNLSNAPANTTNGGCKINFEFPASYGSYQNMIFNSTSNLYQFNTTFATNGTYNWKVNCTGSGDIAFATDTFTIAAGSAGEVPEFSTYAIIIAITIAIGSIFFIRSRNN